MMLWSQLAALLSARGGRSSRGDVYLCLTGEPACNPSELLIKTIVGARRKAPIEWLEKQISEALYREELRRGAGALDIGIYGPAIYREETAHLLAAVRPEFGYLVEEDSPALCLA